MKWYSWIPSFSFIALWLCIIGAAIEKKVHDYYFKRGYDRGMAHARNYHWQYNSLPSKEWQEKHWRHINENNGWVSTK